MALDILDLLSQAMEPMETAGRVLRIIQRGTGVEAAAIRLKHEDDFTYAAHLGFPEEFIKAENCLRARSLDGDPLFDGAGKPLFECTCGLVLTGGTDPDCPWFTRGGSFWCNDTAPILDLAADRDPRLRPRNRCIHSGYQSIAIIPVRSRDRIVGLLQLNDRRGDWFTLDMVTFLEGISGSIGIALERHWMQAELRRNEEHLAQVRKLESLGTLVAGIAHNINNVLAIAMGTASLREQLAREPADLEAYQTIGRVCRRGREVVKSLIHFAQPIPAPRAPLELHGPLLAFRALLGSIAGPGVTIREAHARHPLWINGDAASIGQTLMALCLNALDAMPGGGTLTIRTSLHGTGEAEIAIEDDGAGMTPEVLSHAMEPFFTTREAAYGAGLGLSMAYGVVKAHGGTLDLASEPGRGTTARLRFPLIPAPARDEAVSPVQAPLGSMTVALADDDEDVRFLMTRMLKKAGVRQVKTFPGGEALLASLVSGPLPDLVILDQNMPGLDGIQTMGRIRARHQDLPILISSGQPDVEAWACFQGPAASVIAKPFTMEEIKAKLAILAGKLHPDEPGS